MKSIQNSLALFSALSLAAMGWSSGAIAAARSPAEADLTPNPEQLLIAEYCARVITQRSPLNIRLGPGTNFGVAGQIAKDRMVRVEERNNVAMSDPAWHWLRISRFDRTDGTIQSIASGDRHWVSSRYIGPGFACPANWQ